MSNFAENLSPINKAMPFHTLLRFLSNDEHLHGLTRDDSIANGELRFIIRMQPIAPGQKFDPEANAMEEAEKRSGVIAFSQNEWEAMLAYAPIARVLDSLAKVGIHGINAFENRESLIHFANYGEGELVIENDGPSKGGDLSRAERERFSGQSKVTIKRVEGAYGPAHYMDYDVTIFTRTKGVQLEKDLKAALVKVAVQEMDSVGITGPEVSRGFAEYNAERGR